MLSVRLLHVFASFVAALCAMLAIPSSSAFAVEYEIRVTYGWASGQHFTGPGIQACFVYPKHDEDSLVFGYLTAEVATAGRSHLPTSSLWFTGSETPKAFETGFRWECPMLAPPLYFGADAEARSRGIPRWASPLRGVQRVNIPDFVFLDSGADATFKLVMRMESKGDAARPYYDYGTAERVVSLKKDLLTGNDQVGVPRYFRIFTKLQTERRIRFAAEVSITRLGELPDPNSAHLCRSYRQEGLYLSRQIIPHLESGACDPVGEWWSEDAAYFDRECERLSPNDRDDLTRRRKDAVDACNVELAKAETDARKDCRAYVQETKLMSFQYFGNRCEGSDGLWSRSQEEINSECSRFSPEERDARRRQRESELEACLAAGGEEAPPPPSPRPATELAACTPETFDELWRGGHVTCQCSSDAMVNGIGGRYTAQVWGSDIYSFDSDICFAGRHAGVIDTSGGQVFLEKLAAAESYEATTRNGVTTLAYGSWIASFRFIDQQNYDWQMANKATESDPADTEPAPDPTPAAGLTEDQEKAYCGAVAAAYGDGLQNGKVAAASASNPGAMATLAVEMGEATLNGRFDRCKAVHDQLVALGAIAQVDDPQPAGGGTPAPAPQPGTASAGDSNNQEYCEFVLAKLDTTTQSMMKQGAPAAEVNAKVNAQIDVQNAIDNETYELCAQIEQREFANVVTPQDDGQSRGDQAGSDQSGGSEQAAVAGGALTTGAVSTLSSGYRTIGLPEVPAGTSLEQLEVNAGDDGVFRCKSDANGRLSDHNTITRRACDWPESLYHDDWLTHYKTCLVAWKMPSASGSFANLSRDIANIYAYNGKEVCR